MSYGPSSSTDYYHGFHCDGTGKSTLSTYKETRTPEQIYGPIPTPEEDEWLVSYFKRYPHHWGGLQFDTCYNGYKYNKARVSGTHQELAQYKKMIPRCKQKIQFEEQEIELKKTIVAQAASEAAYKKYLSDAQAKGLQVILGIAYDPTTMKTIPFTFDQL